MGDLFIHILPEVSENCFAVMSAMYILLGIVLFFVIEKFIHWQHCHMPINKGHVHGFAKINLIGDSLHNFIDGLIIGASYLVNPHIGFATTIAIVLHEIPQEIGDFGVLLHGGFSRGKALVLNFLTALTAVVGVVIAIFIGGYVDSLSSVLLPFAAGGFIYIAVADLIPELHKETDVKRSLVQLGAFLLGITIMVLLLLME